MEYAYLTVTTIDNKKYVSLLYNEELKSYCLHAFESKDDAIKQFDGFRDKACSGGYENHISGSMGIINLHPHIIELPKDNPALLGRYVINGKPVHLKGSVFGGFVNMTGVEVSEDILSLSCYDVCKDIIHQVYNR